MGWTTPFLAIVGVLAQGCSGPQSALDPAGRDAEAVAHLFWWMAGGAALVWVAVVALGVVALRSEPGPDSVRHGERWILAGAVAPTVVLAGLLTWGLSLMPTMLAPGPADGIVIEVTGEQWWWRVRYRLPGREPIDLANELRLPVGRRVEVKLASADVVHSFWVPPLAGKIDMIPGRVNRLALEPTRTGTFHGVCAEYCGASHALMMLRVAVLEPAEFERWIAAQAAPAQAPAAGSAERGAALFRANGCGACHAVRGTPAAGVVGPDLTHVGSRLSLAAGVLPNDAEALAHWIAHPDSVKPGALMPGFHMLPPDDLADLASYLAGLR